MANIKSAKKRIKTNEKARLRNKSKKSSMRTSIKRLENLIHDNNKEEAVKVMHLVTKKLDQAAGQGLVHKNYAARQKSRLMNKINNI